MTFNVVGKTDGPNFVTLDQPELTNVLLSGDIVQVENEVYRVFDSGNKGLKYWKVTSEWYGQMDAEADDYAATLASFEQMAGRI